MSTPEKIANLIPLVFQQEQQWKYQLLRNWQTIFGKMSDKVYLERIHQETLILAVYDACWMQELYSLSPLLLTSINNTLDKPYVKQLRFKRAGIRQQKTCPVKEHTPTINKKSIMISATEQKALSAIKDAQLAAVLKDFLVRCYCEREIYKKHNTSLKKNGNV